MIRALIHAALSRLPATCNADPDSTRADEAREIRWATETGRHAHTRPAPVSQDWIGGRAELPSARVLRPIQRPSAKRRTP
jgi:hypothetical protein